MDDLCDFLRNKTTLSRFSTREVRDLLTELDGYGYEIVAKAKPVEELPAVVEPEPFGGNAQIEGADFEPVHDDPDLAATLIAAAEDAHIL